jgi:hypothetical protein
MLTLVPKGWFTWRFSVEDSMGTAVAELNLTAWRERGSLIIGGREHQMSRTSLTGPFVLTLDDAEVAQAVKLSVFRYEFTITHAGAEYTLKRVSTWRRQFDLLQGDQKLGSVAPLSLLSRRAKIDLPYNLDLALQGFVAWLTLLMWKRDADSAGA